MFFVFLCQKTIIYYQYLVAIIEVLIDITYVIIILIKICYNFYLYPLFIKLYNKEIILLLGGGGNCPIKGRGAGTFIRFRGNISRFSIFQDILDQNFPYFLNTK